MTKLHTSDVTLLKWIAEPIATSEDGKTFIAEATFEERDYPQRTRQRRRGYLLYTETPLVELYWIGKAAPSEDEARALIAEHPSVPQDA